MPEEFHEVADATEVTSASAFAFPRARALASAVDQHPHYALIRLLRRSASAEYLIVDVEVDQVPYKNPYGIQYRERLALCVPDNPRSLVDVRALRKGFPILAHQN